MEKVIHRKETVLSPWLTLVEKTVQLNSGKAIYHCLKQDDYMTVMALTEDKKIPIVRQFRIGIETYSWELPGGLVDKNQTPEIACRLELLEETGLVAKDIYYLGKHIPDSGRLENYLHSFFVTAFKDPRHKFIPEVDVEPKLVTLEELVKMAVQGQIVNHHISIIFLALQNPAIAKLFQQ
ncbi:MAG: NUDIX hydrolase [Alphaproteobacteria bacterium]|nr:NUDIX hydrolase [Alphaproteobacteria bacterium]